RGSRRRRARESVSCGSPFPGVGQCDRHRRRRSGSSASRRAGRGRFAAVGGQIIEERTHVAKIWAVIDEPSVLARDDETRVREFLQMKRQRGWRELQAFSDCSGGKPGRRMANEQPEDREPVFLGQRTKGGKGFLRFHISSIIESMADVKGMRSDAVIPGRGPGVSGVAAVPTLRHPPPIPRTARGILAIAQQSWSAKGYVPQ